MQTAGQILPLGIHLIPNVCSLLFQDVKSPEKVQFSENRYAYSMKIIEFGYTCSILSRVANESLK